MGCWAYGLRCTLSSLRHALDFEAHLLNRGFDNSNTSAMRMPSLGVSSRTAVLTGFAARVLAVGGREHRSIPDRITSRIASDIRASSRSNRSAFPPEPSRGWAVLGS